ncbi:MAG: DNA polymerase III subunit gamma/tau [Acidobacteria bacterium]|nr:MAG: DNA polymerase III subunit gamma/tau [Acidobacteriota bacterium]
MSYQVIARKWRPQKFEDVVGQEAVTRTLRNALASGRIAQAFVFAGPRGVGKTTTARILARALSCGRGPTADPCGVCDACKEIAEGRDMDVLEIDAATHTGIDNIREVIISGLAIMPVRDRYKIFIIDEVHQLSGPSFNALLKSIEEPPPHVVFMMATTELDKIPETVLSRSQVYEFRTISTQRIADQLRRIVDVEGITVGEDSLRLIARDAEGSMRDGQSKLDQVIAFAGRTITPEDVATVLGLVGRDLLIDTIEAVADENAPASFALAARAVEMGYDLRAVCRELSRVVRDLLVLSVDPSRITDPEIAGEGERDRLEGLAGRFSREDLLRAFDLLTRAEAEVRTAAQPRYHLEMALLRWMHLRKLVPIEELIASAGAGSLPGRTLPARPAPTAARTAPPAAALPPLRAGSGSSRTLLEQPAAQPAATPSSTASPTASPTLFSTASPTLPSTASPTLPSTAPPAPVVSDFSRTVAPAGSLKDALLAAIRSSKDVFYNMVIAQAQKVEMAGDRVTFSFSPSQRTLCETFEQNRPWLETIARQTAGRKIVVAAVQTDAAAAPAEGGQPPEADRKSADRKSALRQQALADAGVQAVLEIFPAEIRDVEEL